MQCAFKEKGCPNREGVFFSTVITNIAQALKAVALARSGATQEALEICSNLQKSTPPPTDETLLNTMQLVYKAAEKSMYWRCKSFLIVVGDEMITCYENAWGVDPRNETLASGLFFSCVRSANYAKQQQVCIHMVNTNNRLSGGP